MGFHSPFTIHYSRLLAAALLLLMSGCSNVGYYWQSVSGQLEIWRRERPVEELIGDAAVPEPLKQKLASVTRIRDFASKELGLPDNQSYRRYADLERPFVVWNVFAAPEFSLRPVQWCFLFAGCVSYRGYFAKADADRFAADLAAEGHDVYVGGVPAYSTLGWFADPLLNTFMHYPEFEIARLIFHELAHQLVYVRDDTVFNESFAVAIEQEGVARLLARSGDQAGREEFERNRRIRAEFVQLVRKYQSRLDVLYRSRVAPEAMRDRKRAVLADMESEYRGLRETWGGYAGYDRWFAARPNNAQIASVALYTLRVPAFEALLRQQGGDLARFYDAVKELAALPKGEREARLDALSPAGDAKR